MKGLAQLCAQIQQTHQDASSAVSYTHLPSGQCASPGIKRETISAFGSDAGDE